MTTTRRTTAALTSLALLISACADAGAASAPDCPPPNPISTGSFVEVGAELGLRDPDDGANQFGIFGLAAEMGGGVAVWDLDRDGWDDVIATYPNRTPRILLNRCGSDFEDVSVAWLPGDLGPTTTALAADFTGDGYADLFLGGLSDEDDRFLVGTETGFVDRSFDSGIVPDQFDPRPKSTFGATASDVDLDGDLDLFIARWAEYQWQGSPSQLLINDGAGNFHDGNADAGLESLDDVPAYTATFANWDDDPYPELFVAADFGASQFYDATGPATYVNRTAELGLGGDENGMGSVVADLTGDGVLDWFVGSIHFEGACPEISFGCTGNRLYAGSGSQGGPFTDITDEAGVRDGDWSWGTIAEDLDHDGLLDIVQVGGAGALGWPSTVKPPLPTSLQPPDSTACEMVEDSARSMSTKTATSTSSPMFTRWASSSIAMT